MQNGRLGAVRVAERDRLVVAEPRAEERTHADVVALRGDRQREPPADRERGRAQSDVAPGRDRAGEGGERLGCEVVPPAADGRDAVRRQAEERERRSGRDVARQAEHGRRRSGIAVERGAVQDRHELGQILGEDERRRHCEARLVLLPAQEGRAVGDGEERQAEARDEERRGDRGVSRVAGQRRRGEPQRDRAAPAGAAERAQRRREQARRDDRGGEDDQRRHEQQERARPAAARQLLRVDRAARPADEHDGDRAERSNIERRHGQPAELHGRARAPSRRGAALRRSRRRSRPARPPRREKRVHDDVADRRAGSRRDERGDATADDPADDGPGSREGERLGERVQLDLPAPRTEPDEAAARVGDVAAQRSCREDREGEQQCAALAAEQEQAPRRGLRRRCRGRQLARSAR